MITVKGHAATLEKWCKYNLGIHILVYCHFFCAATLKSSFLKVKLKAIKSGEGSGLACSFEEYDDTDFSK